MEVINNNAVKLMTYLNKKHMYDTIADFNLQGKPAQLNNMLKFCADCTIFLDSQSAKKANRQTSCIQIKTFFQN